MLKYALLGFLSYQPMTGYELENHFRSSAAHFWHTRLSQIYMTLRDLETDGWVVSTVEAQEKRPDRRVYELTTAGKEALHVWLAEPLTERSLVKDTLLLKLFFSAAAGKRAILKQLHIQRDLHRAQLKLYQEDAHALAQQQVAIQPALARDALLWESVRDFGTKFEHLYVEWLEETIQKIESEFPETS
ncbi:MAG: PadR family transcriptional regulator [Chloroflexota bacterium]|nr:PadR family transcriptional regulator [Chloroflexota bacterium]